MITSVLAGRLRLAGLAALAASSALLVAACSGGQPGRAASSPQPDALDATVSATPVATITPQAPGTPAPPGNGLPRCRTGQLSAAFTNQNSASGGATGMTLVLTNRSTRTCSLYGFVGLRLTGAFHDFPRPLPTHVTRVNAPYSPVTLYAGGNAQAQLTWHYSRLSPGTPEYPQRVEITPPGATRHLTGRWPTGAVIGGKIELWPLRRALPGPVPTGTGTIKNPFNGMCVTASGTGSTNGTQVVAAACGGDSSQQWTAYSDGTLRINGECLDVTGGSNAIGAIADLWSCDAAASQRWKITQVSLNPFGPVVDAGSDNVLTDPGDSTVDGTPLEMGVNRGDQSGPWQVSFFRYLGH